MGSSPCVGRIGAIAVASLLFACGGESQFSSGDDSGEASGGMEASGGSSSGGSGGASSNGGVGGIVPSTGGAPSCPACPEADYGLVIEGDGAPYEMRFNGLIEPSSERAVAICSEAPLRGWVGGCSRAIVVWACEGMMSGRPCLEIDGGKVSYVDRQRGELFTGTVTSDLPSTSISGVKSGTLTLNLSNPTGEMLVLTVRYTFCETALSSVRIVC